MYPTSDSEIRQAFAHSTPFIHSAATFRRASFDRAGGYRTAFVDAQDLDLWLRIAESCDVRNLPQHVVRYRVHAGQTTYLNLEQQAMSALAARLGWRARAAGRPDPFLTTSLIDRDSLEAAGVTEADVTKEFVPLAVWLAKTVARAARRHDADELFAAALERARTYGTPAMVDEVRHQRERVLPSRRSRLRGRLSSLRRPGSRRAS